MERFNTRSIDELGMMVIPQDLRQRLGLESGSKLLLHPINTLAILYKIESDAGTNGFAFEMDDLGRIKLSQDIRAKFGWELKDKLAVYGVDNIIILKRDAA